MTIKKYFTQEQPISTQVIDEVYYKDIQTITFGTTHYYAQIKIAHIGEDTWAFGWEIKNGRFKDPIKRDCTPNITTQGNIRKLVYGMTKVLQRQVLEMHCPTERLMCIVENAIAEASIYYSPTNNY